MRFALALAGGLALLAPEAARAQYIDGLPAASTVAPSDDVVVCQGGVTGKPGSCTPRRATVTQFETSLPGNVAGALNVGGTATFKGLVNLTGETTANYNVQDGAQFLSNFNPTFSGGGQVIESNGRFNITTTAAPSTNFWNVLAQTNFAGTGTSSIGDAGASYVSVYAQTNRKTAPAGGRANNPRMWAAVLEYHDYTNTNSSSTSAGLILEGDMSGNGVDDGNNREGILSLVMASTPTAQGGLPMEADEAFGTNGGLDAQWKRLFAANGNYRDAAIDTRGADDNGSAAAARPTVTANVTASNIVPVSNVLPFTAKGLVYFGNSIWNFAAIGQVVSYAYTGNGPAGTLTLASPVTVSAGTQALNNSRTVWMKDNQTFCMNFAGSDCLWSDGTNFIVQGGMKFNSPAIFNFDATVIQGKSLIFAGTGGNPQPILNYSSHIATDAGIVASRDFEAAGALVVGTHLLVGVNGAPPTVSGCGTGAVIGGGDSKFNVSTGSGGPTSCAITFNVPFAAAPFCVATTSDPTIGVGISGPSSSGVTLAFSGAASNKNVYVHCEG